MLRVLLGGSTLVLLGVTASVLRSEVSDNACLASLGLYLMGYCYLSVMQSKTRPDFLADRPWFPAVYIGLILYISNHAQLEGEDVVLLILSPLFGIAGRYFFGLHKQQAHKQPHGYRTLS